MALTDVHHVVIRVEDFDSSVKNWESILGYSVSRIDQNQDLGIQQAFFDLPGGGFIEIVSPTDPEGAVGKAISSRGEGIHTLSMSVFSSWRLPWNQTLQNFLEKTERMQDTIL